MYTAQGCASDLCMCVCVCVCVCWYYFANLWTVSVCLPVHTVTQKHTHTQATRKTQANACQVMIEHLHFQSNTVLCKLPRATRTLTKAMKALQKHRMAEPSTGCCPQKSPWVEKKQRVRQPPVRYTQKNKQKKEHIYTYTDTQVCMLVCTIVWDTRANQS